MYRVFFSFIFFGFWCVCGQLVQSPCPDYFDYVTDSSGTYGVIMLQPFDLPVPDLTVRGNFTVAVGKPLTQTGSLKPVFKSKHLLQDFNRGVPLKYQVNFPVTSPLPKITSLTVNDNVVCYATGDRPEGKVTEITLRHTLHSSKSISNGVYNDLPPQTQRPITESTDYVVKLSEPREPTTPSKSVYGEMPQHIPTSTTESPSSRLINTDRPAPNPIQSSSTSNSMQCGINSSPIVPLIVQGYTYERGEMPWLVAIYKIQMTGLRYTCAGTLISATHVISAAHCMKGSNVKNLIVKAGVHNLDDWTDDITVTRTLKAAVIHEAYEASTLANDLLVMTLQKPVPFGTYIKPACLWSGNPDLNRVVGKVGVVAGWGKNEFGTEGTGEPRMVRIPIVSTEKCRASKRVFHQLTSTDKTLCAGNHTGSGPCTGDSGGGLYIYYKRRWRLRGVVSLALMSENEDDDIKCNLEEYIVFTDTAQYLPWISKVISV